MSDTARRAHDRWFRALTVVSIVIGFLTGLIYLWAMFAEEFGSAFSGEDPNPAVGGVALTAVIVGSMGLLLRWARPALGLVLTLAATLPVVVYSSHAPWGWGLALLAFAVHLTLLLDVVDMGARGRVLVGLGVVGVLVVLGTPSTSFSYCEINDDSWCFREVRYRALVYFPEPGFVKGQSLVLRAVFALLAVLLIAIGRRPLR